MAGEIIQMLVTSFVGSLGFGLMLHAPRRALLPAAGLGAASYLVSYLLLNVFGFSSAMANLIAASAASILSQWAARRMRMIALVFLATALIPLVPGLGLYQCMSQLAAGDNVMALQTGVETMKIILMLALGMGFGTFVFGTAHKTKAGA